MEVRERHVKGTEIKLNLVLGYVIWVFSVVSQ